MIKKRDLNIYLKIIIIKIIKKLDKTLAHDRAYEFQNLLIALSLFLRLKKIMISRSNWKKKWEFAKLGGWLYKNRYFVKVKFVGTVTKLNFIPDGLVS